MSPDGTTRRGRLVLVVGPSGAGKDTLMRLAARALGGRTDVTFARRLVTRASGAHEDHDTIDEPAFEAAFADRVFPLAWKAHGLGYALPGTIVDDLRQGRTVVANVSRSVVDDARCRFANVAVVLVTAPVEELARRVAARGRDADTAQRVGRDAPAIEVLIPDLVIENVGDPVVAAAKLSGFLSRAVSCAAP
ncbi:phosphonate metabolism protein/1,5-bisphosphokinase (PRPP-forming) PhnN [uncultured Alsobacter sp.]|uniref:phosphonate metabolism protein/1,5-bisphosphokinase (PRPP-forming) PhnN n=1 Tax=uncultured Alsobacter sp. TaxID=1748258 RepID=UPI0025E51ECB|nr:phosphonate metabolism protein/1,5-bisphosphokinase (PRPP-forming) PhnN [uncultured Alsobacter sp.]